MPVDLGAVADRIERSRQAQAFTDAVSTAVNRTRAVLLARLAETGDAVTAASVPAELLVDDALWARMLIDSDVVEALWDLMEVTGDLTGLVAPGLWGAAAEQAAVALADQMRSISRWSTTMRRTVGQLTEKAAVEGWDVFQLRDALDQDLALGSTASMRIARTELYAAMNGSFYQMVRATGMTGMLEWNSTRDMRTRPTHVEAHGQLVRVGQPFIVGGYEALRPGDPQLPVRERVHCRCNVLFIPDDETAEPKVQGRVPAAQSAVSSLLDGMKDRLLSGAIDEPVYGRTFASPPPVDSLDLAELLAEALLLQEQLGQVASGSRPGLIEIRAEQPLVRMPGRDTILHWASRDQSAAAKKAWETRRRSAEPQTQTQPRPPAEQFFTPSGGGVTLVHDPSVIAAHGGHTYEAEVRAYGPAGGAPPEMVDGVAETLAGLLSQPRFGAVADQLDPVLLRVCARGTATESSSAVTTTDGSIRVFGEYQYVIESFTDPSQRQSAAPRSEVYGGVVNYVDLSGEGIIRHEFGHAALGQERAETQERWGKLVDGLGAETIRAGVSGYAARNPHEAFAEVFSAVTHPGFTRSGIPDEALPLYDFVGDLYGLDVSLTAAARDQSAAAKKAWLTRKRAAEEAARPRRPLQVHRSGVTVEACEQAIRQVMVRRVQRDIADETGSAYRLTWRRDRGMSLGHNAKERRFAENILGVVDGDERLIKRHARDVAKEKATEKRNGPPQASTVLGDEGHTEKVIAAMDEAVKLVEANPKVAAALEKYGAPAIVYGHAADGNEAEGQYDSFGIVKLYPDHPFASPKATGPVRSGGDTLNVTNGYDGVIRHEIGHHVDSMLPAADFNRWRDATREWGGVVGGRWQERTDYGDPDGSRGLSWYGRTNSEEAFAETFALVTAPDYDRSAVDERILPMVDLMEEFLA